jgi:hypothetical protein
MANAFERHGLDHLSASSINLFAAQPAMWAMQKLMGRKSMVGPAAHRGTAIEAGVEMGLFEPSAPVEACQEAAIARFNQLTALSADPAVEKERANIAPAVAIALAELRQYGVPEAAGENRQHRIEVQLPGVPVPFIGWLDFWYPAHGIIVDLKTRHACPRRSQIPMPARARSTMPPTATPRSALLMSRPRRWASTGWRIHGATSTGWSALPSRSSDSCRCRTMARR